MRQVPIKNPEELTRVLDPFMRPLDGLHMDWMGRSLMDVLHKFRFEVGPHDHGWYSCAPGPGEPYSRLWYVKASSLEWAICAGALACNGLEVVFTGVPPTTTI